MERFIWNLVRRGLGAVLAFLGLLILVPMMIPSASSEPTVRWLNALGMALVVAAILLWVYAPDQLPAMNPILKRAVVWTSAVLVFLVWYVASASPIMTVTNIYCPAVSPAVSVFYAPLAYYVHYELPGSGLISKYDQWWYRDVVTRLR